ncbi:MAG: helix-hairpin-helix domain-containing protein [Lachnospiraceae bacterium]|jgi:competence protein ComEA|nr:helix-hairpin-helix domain-containing protein [Lachnospiraceae bacterium]
MRNRKTDFLKVVAIVLFLTGCGSAQTYLTGQLERSTTGGENFSVAETEQSETEETEDEHTQAEEEAPAVCFVHVSGAVREPGVYELPEGSRLYEAIGMAGGFTEEAAAAYCNLAAVLEDGAQYHIPTEEEAGSMPGGSKEGVGSPTGAYDAQGRLDLNRASKEELMQLTGIGESKAEAILSYREEHGGFADAEELKQVSGIGDATFEKLQDDITVR